MDIVRIRTIRDPSSFLHAILNAYFLPYRSNQFQGLEIQRRNLVGEFRKQLAARLTHLHDPSQSSMVRVYDVLSRGRYRELARRGLFVFSLETMVAELTNPLVLLDDKYLELIADVCFKDIYILDAVQHDVYVCSEDQDVHYRHRPSIIVLALPGHFETVGLRLSNGDVITLFDPSHPLIQWLYERYAHVQSTYRETDEAV